MSNVIYFKPKPNQPHFTISAIQEEQGWLITIDRFHDWTMEPHQAMREIAEALIPMAGGLVRTAEELEPSEQGRIVSCISIYSGGHIEFQSEPIDTPERRDWLATALLKVKKKFATKKKRKP